MAILGTTACGCAHEALTDIAVERNIEGIQQCSVEWPDVTPEHAATRGCSRGSNSILNEGSIQNEQEKDRKEQEETLF